MRPLICPVCKELFNRPELPKCNFILDQTVTFSCPMCQHVMSITMMADGSALVPKSLFEAQTKNSEAMIK